MTKFSKEIMFFSLLLFAIDTNAIAKNFTEDTGVQESLEPQGVDTRRKPPSLSLMLPFDAMISRLRSIDTGSRVNLWCEEIGKYYWGNSFISESTSLSQLRDQILKNELPSGGADMVNRAIGILILSGHREYKDLKTPPTFVRPPTPFAPRVTFSDDDVLPKTVTTPPCPLGLEILRSPVEAGSAAYQSDSDSTGFGGLVRDPTIYPESWFLPAAEPIYAASRTLPTSFIKQHLQKFIAGQDDALASLSLIVHRFLCNGILMGAGQNPACRPSHCILTGPSGSGKSETLRQLNLFAGIPVLYINAPSITAEGYKGVNFSEVVGNFWKSNNQPKSAIVVLEEIDKLGSASGDREERKNFGDEIQKLLLSSLDGNPVATANGVCDLRNWLFIGTGAFSMLGSDRGRGATRKVTATTHEDLKKSGFLPEFANRFRSIIPYSAHTVDSMLEVLKKDGSPLEEIKSEFKRFYNVDLTFDPAVLKRLAEVSLKVDTGVRAIHTILGKVLEPYYDFAASLMIDKPTVPEKRIVVSLDGIEKGLAAFTVKEEEQDKAYLSMYM